MNTSTVSLPAGTVAKIVAAVAKINGPRFVGVTYRSKSTGELARHTLIVGADYRALTVKSMEELTRLLPSLTDLRLQAANELLVSYSKSLLAMDTNTAHPDYTKADTYENIVPGIKLNRNDGTLELAGLSHAKRVIEQGVYKTVNSRPLTIAKQEIEKQLSRSKYRTLAIDADAMESIRIGGSEIECE